MPRTHGIDRNSPPWHGESTTLYLCTVPGCGTHQIEHFNEPCAECETNPRMPYKNICSDCQLARYERNKP